MTGDLGDVFSCGEITEVPAWRSFMRDERLSQNPEKKVNQVLDMADKTMVCIWPRFEVERVSSRAVAVRMQQL
jgi:hypothetical protein